MIFGSDGIDLINQRPVRTLLYIVLVGVHRSHGALSSLNWKASASQLDAQSAHAAGCAASGQVPLPWFRKTESCINGGRGQTHAMTHSIVPQLPHG